MIQQHSGKYVDWFWLFSSQSLFMYVVNKDGQSETIELVTSADEFPIQ